jgi:hypothetical protein
MQMRRIHVRDTGTSRLLTQLLVMEHLVREPRSEAFTRLERALGSRLALRAVSVAQGGAVR